MNNTKFFSLQFLILFTVLISTSIVSNAQDNGDITYYLAGAGEGLIVKDIAEGYSGDLVIPSEAAYDGKKYPVIGIGYEAFMNCKGLTSITIPNTVKEINHSAFKGCSSLKKLTIEDSTDEISMGYYENNNYRRPMFQDCPLETVYLGRDLTDDDDYWAPLSPFSLNQTINSVTISNFVTEIRKNAFCGTAITSITIPNSVRTIKDYAFAGCESLKRFVIEDGGDEDLFLWDRAFTYSEDDDSRYNNDCPLEYIYIGRNVESPLAKNIKNKLSVIIGSNVTSLSFSMFEGCSGLTSITLPDSIEIIERNAFKNCINLSSINFPNKITTIGKSAFEGCSSLTSVIKIPDSITTLEESVFSGCSGITSINIGNSVESIGTSAFNGCSGLTSINIGNSVESIGTSAFNGCSGLTSVSIGSAVTRIGESAFDGCTSLKDLRFEDGENRIDILFPYNQGHITTAAMFRDCPLKTIYIGRNLWYESYRYYGPFHNIKTIESVQIGNHVTRLEYKLFEGCSGLKPVTSNATTLSIGEYAFKECSELESFPFTDSIISIGKEAFYKCSKLKNVTLSKNITGVGSYAFSHCTSLNELIIQDSPDPLSMSDNQFNGCPLSTLYIGRDYFRKDNPYFEDSPFKNNSITNLTIGEMVTIIGDNAFYGGGSIKNVTIKDGTEPLILGFNNGCFLFQDSHLDSLYLGRDLDYNRVHNDSPFGWQSLKSLVIGDFVTTIYDSMFRHCGSLTSVEMGKSVTNIGSEAFIGCNIQSINLGTSLTYIGPGAFQECPLTSLNIPNTINAIEDNTFKDCAALTSLTIPNSIRSIGNFAFQGCEKLKSLIIPNSVISIGDQAFENCYDITHIVFGRFLSKIGNNSFRMMPYSSRRSKLELIETFSYNIEGIEASGLSNDIPVILKTDSDYAGISSTNLTYFDNLLLKHNDKDYALVISAQDLNFSNCIFSEKDAHVILLKDCTAKYYNTNQYITFRGIEITSQLSNEDGYSFMPSVNPKDNIFDIYGDAADALQTKIITIEQAGTLFDTLDLQNIEKIQALTISGDINGTDVMTINRMTSLKYLDITNANIVSGGATYRENLKTNYNVVGKHFFSDINLEVIHLPNSAREIEDYAFAGTTIKVATISSSILKIGTGAFYGCSDLKYIFIPRSITQIGNTAFYNCTHLKNVDFEDGKNILTFGGKHYNSGTFTNCPIENINLGRNISYPTNDVGSPKEYEQSPFYNLKSLITVTISDKVTYIPDYAFYGCTGLTDIVIPKNVKTIGAYSFNNCSSLNTIKLPDLVKSIGEGAFKDCCLITEINIPTYNINKINDHVFEGCKNLVSVDIPDNITSIGNSAFSGCENLTSIVIPNTVTTTGDYVFNKCTSLNEVIISSKMTSLGDYLFNECTSLTHIIIPENIVSIGNYAFYKTAFSEIILPEFIKSIGDYAFGGNSGLVKVYSLNSTPPEILITTFDNEVRKTADLHVQKGSLVYYWLDPIWKEFTNMTDDVLCLQAIPDAKYGDGEIDLSLYAPEGIALKYQTSNDDVVRINGSKMQIVGAGTATIGAILDEEGSHTELMGQMRRIFVDQADLTITVEDIVIEQGNPIPDFTYLANGLQYDDTIEDIENLPQPIHEVNDSSPEGEYAITFTEGSDRNYRIITKPSKIVVTRNSGTIDLGQDQDDIEVYNMDGVIIYKGLRSAAVLEKGMYIVRQGKIARKIIVN